MDHLTVTEAAEELNVSVPTVKRYIYNDELRSAKLPGGQHRIPRSEIDRLLTPEGEVEAGEATPRGIEDRLEMIERWLSDLQSEVDCMASTLQVLSSYCGRVSAREGPTGREGEPTRVLILGTGCSKCDHLYELTAGAVHALDREDLAVDRVTDPEEIAAFGPLLTPALVVDDAVLLSGRVPSDTDLRDLLEEHLAEE
jgi:excisionase family DNA binding protein